MWLVERSAYQFGFRRPFVFPKFQWEMLILGMFSTVGLLLFVVGRGCSYVVHVK